MHSLAGAVANWAEAAGGTIPGHSNGPMAMEGIRCKLAKGAGGATAAGLLLKNLDLVAILGKSCYVLYIPIMAT